MTDGYGPRHECGEDLLYELRGGPRWIKEWQCRRAGPNPKGTVSRFWIMWDCKYTYPPPYLLLDSSRSQAY